MIRPLIKPSTQFKESLATLCFFIHRFAPGVISYLYYHHNANDYPNAYQNNDGIKNIQGILNKKEEV